MNLQKLQGLKYPDNIQIIIWKGGGDDTMNVLPPLEQFDEYKRRRPTVHLDKAKILRLDGTDKLGMHPELAGLRELYDDGEVALFPNVGYDNFDRSHFSGTDKVLAGVDGHTPLSKVVDGVHARMLAGIFPSYPEAYPNANMEHPPVLLTASGPTLFLQGPNSQLGMTLNGGPDTLRRLVRDTDQPISMTDAAGIYYNNIRYIDNLNDKVEGYSRTLSQAYASNDNTISFTTGRIAKQLEIIARLIKGGSKTRIYVVYNGGYDTHSKQVVNGSSHLGFHADLQKDLSEGVTSFIKELRLSGDYDRVNILMHSEFGRNVNENTALGTDHGTTGAMVVIGKTVKGGVYGNYPLMVDSNIIGDAFHTYDYHYNQIHRTIAENWCGMSAIGLKLMGLDSYAPIDFLPDADAGKEKDLNYVGDKIVEGEEVVEEITADAVADTYSILENQSLTANVSLNDTPCSEGTTLYSLILGTEVGGQVTAFNPNTGEFTFLPDTGFYGEASFQYDVFCDEIEDSAKVTILVEENVVVGEGWQEAVAALDAKVETIKTDILSLLQQIELDQQTQNSRLDGLNSGLTEVNAKVSQIESRLSEIDNSISGVAEMQELVDSIKELFT